MPVIHWAGWPETLERWISEGMSLDLNADEETVMIRQRDCWEDICGKSGPLISPDIFDECVAPGYCRIRNTLERHGIKLLSVDSDGDVSKLVGHWLEAGSERSIPHGNRHLEG